MWDLSSFLQLRCIRILGKYHAGFKSIEDGHFTEVMLIKSNEDEIRNEVKGAVVRLKKPVRCYSRPYESAQNIIIKCTVRLTGYEFNGYVQVQRMKPGFGMVNGYIKKESIMRILTE